MGWTVKWKWSVQKSAVVFDSCKGMSRTNMLFLVNGSADLLVLGLGDCLMGDARQHTLVNSGIVTTISLHELLDGMLGGVHRGLGIVRDHLDWFCRVLKFCGCGAEVLYACSSDDLR